MYVHYRARCARTYRDEHLKCINALETVLQSSDKLRCFSGKALMQVSNHCSVTVTRQARISLTKCMWTTAVYGHLQNEIEELRTVLHRTCYNAEMSNKGLLTTR